MKKITIKHEYRHSTYLIRRVPTARHANGWGYSWALTDGQAQLVGRVYMSRSAAIAAAKRFIDLNYYERQ
jgi:hypothetical protein